MSIKGVLVGLTVSLSSCAGCGYTQRGNEAVGQVKLVAQETPLLCPDYTWTSISLGVMRAGVGSMSTHDANYLVRGPNHVFLLKKAAESGRLVKIITDRYRASICIPTEVITSVELVTE